MYSKNSELAKAYGFEQMADDFIDIKQLDYKHYSDDQQACWEEVERYDCYQPVDKIPPVTTISRLLPPEMPQDLQRSFLKKTFFIDVGYYGSFDTRYEQVNQVADEQW